MLLSGLLRRTSAYFPINRRELDKWGPHRSPWGKMTPCRRPATRPRQRTHSSRRCSSAVPPDPVMAAFFDPAALSEWWQAIGRSTTRTAARCLRDRMGAYGRARRRARTPGRRVPRNRDGVLPGRELFIADAWWVPPDDEPIGPMALEVSCMLEGASCRLRVRQSGFDDSPAGARYYAVIAAGGNRRWHRSRSIWSADPPDVKEVGVGPVLFGTDVDEHDDGAGDKRPRSTSSGVRRSMLRSAVMTGATPHSNESAPATARRVLLPGSARPADTPITAGPCGPRS